MVNRSANASERGLNYNDLSKVFYHLIRAAMSSGTCPG
jgi:hypothetical protein